MAFVTYSDTDSVPANDVANIQIGLGHVSPGVRLVSAGYDLSHADLKVEALKPLTDATGLITDWVLRVRNTDSSAHDATLYVVLD